MQLRVQRVGKDEYWVGTTQPMTLEQLGAAVTLLFGGATAIRIGNEMEKYDLQVGKSMFIEV